MWKGSRTLIEASAPPGKGADPLSDLARRAKAGDAASTRALLLAIMPSLLRVARQVLGRDHPEVNDVAQDAAFGVLRGLQRFRGDSTVLHFACRAGVLAAMNVRRRELSHARKTRHLSALAETDGRCTEANPEEAMLGQRSLVAMRELLGSLPEAQAEVLGLHHVVGLTAGEIAALIGAPLETVRSRLRLGRQALRERIERDEGITHPKGIRNGHAR